MTDILDKTSTPWLPVASRVLAGHFDGADLMTLLAVEIGLRHIQHDDCQKATEKVRKMIARLKKKVADEGD